MSLDLPMAVLFLSSTKFRSLAWNRETLSELHSQILWEKVLFVKPFAYIHYKTLYSVLANIDTAISPLKGSSCMSIE